MPRMMWCRCADEPLPLQNEYIKYVIGFARIELACGTLIASVFNAKMTI